MELDILKKAITRVLQVYVLEINEDSTFGGDLGADSIDMMQIFQCVEQELGIHIKDVDLEKVITVRDALHVIMDAIGKNNV